MTSHILDQVPFRLNRSLLMKKLRIKEDTRYSREFLALADEVEAIARPKALYRVSFIDSLEQDQVVIDGVTFRSRVLAVNLEAVHRVFPYTATCGVEVDDWSHSVHDLLHSFWVDTMKELAVRAAMAQLRLQVKRRFEPGRISAMSPGSLGDWPIQQQKPLFALLGDAEAQIGVRLNDSFLMIPSKSVSGIWFPTQTNFESCQLCPRDRCPGRRSAYDPGLYEKRYTSV
ncbi:MAG: vitamin B12 dependent methionine synthase, partial [Chloroflexi bacterium]|nr:vitamin B12 dependent methionine synthase [Chloroflexota bacterium]